MKYLFAVVIVLFFSCNKDLENNPTKISGIVSAQGISTYQYGTHILTDDNGNLLYALRSNCTNLDKYLNKNVEIKGRKIKGYPVSGGPEYLEVSNVDQ